MQNGTGLGWRLAQRAAEQPDRVALSVVHDGPALSLTHAALDVAGRRTAAALGERFGAGERILLPHNDAGSFAIGLLGCLHAGLVAVPMPALSGPAGHGERLASTARDARPAALLAASGHLSGYAQWRDQYALTTLPVLAIDDMARAGDPLEPRPVAPDRLALLQYTSGSTDSPRGVMLSHGNLAHNVDGLWADLGRDGASRAGGWLPLHHDMGLALLLGPLLRGGTSVLMPPAEFVRRPHRWLRLIDEHDLAFTAAPDFAYALCARRVGDEQLAGLDLHRWRRALNGAEPVRAETIARFNARFAAAGLGPHVLTGGYGLAEATVYVSGFGPDRPRTLTVDRDALARGVIAPAGEDSVALVGCGRSRHLDVAVVDPRTRMPRPDGSVGEVWVRGGSVAAGYWDRPEETAATFGAVTATGAAGFLRTGDLGVLHDDELFLTGRIKEVLLVRGRTLYPHDIEARARRNHPELRTGLGAAFSLPARDADAVVLVHEVRGRPAPQRLDELVRGIRADVAEAFGVRLDTIVLTRPGAIPRTTSGKVRRGATRDLLMAGALPRLGGDGDGTTP